jgi:hypothetical protein
MLRSLLLITLFCTCGPAQVRAQFTYSVSTGYIFGTFNQQPELIGAMDIIGQDGHFKAINSVTVGLEINYAPANKAFSGGLQVSYSRRGHEHLVKRADGELEHGFSFPSHIDYLDIAPRLTYRPGRLFSASIGPYFSLGRKFVDNPFLIEFKRRTNSHDYGVIVGGRLHFGRLFVYTAYQRSMRDYDFTSIPSSQPSGTLLSTEQPFSISTLQVGIGYTILR